MGLCVVEVEVTVSSRPSKVGGSARITRQSLIACAKSSRTPPPPASVGVGPSGRLLAAVPAATSPVSPPPRTAIRARLRDTWKKPRNRGAPATGPKQTVSSPEGGRDFRGLRASAQKTRRGCFGRLSGVPRRLQLRPDRHARLRHVVLDLGHSVVLVVEDRCAQHGVCARGHRLHEVLELACPA